MRNHPIHPVRGRAGERGLSLIEALIAMALLLLVAIGILPLFTRSMVNNAAGSEATQTANHARGQLEDVAQLSFNNVALRLAGGNQLLTEDAYFSGELMEQGDEHWETAGNGTGLVLYNRTTRVRQYSLNGLVDSDADNVIDGIEGLTDADDDGEFDNPMPDGTATQFLHIKEISVEVITPRAANGRNAGPLGSAPTYQVRSFKSF
jgi:type II secretory pathway pseudopilin PulG